VTPDADPVLSAFHETGAYLRGHFRLTSGLHSAEYLQCALVLQHPKHAERFGEQLAAEFRQMAAEAEIGIVASPAIGGLIIGHEVARALGARFIFTERDEVETECKGIRNQLRVFAPIDLVGGCSRVLMSDGIVRPSTKRTHK